VSPRSCRELIPFQGNDSACEIADSLGSNAYGRNIAIAQIIETLALSMLRLLLSIPLEHCFPCSFLRLLSSIPKQTALIMPGHATLIPPPAPPSSHAAIESVLELTHLADIEPNLFTNTRPLWHPPGARGIYGGAVIAQCLAAAQLTVPDAFYVHSMHCYFVLNGNAEIPIIYHVEHVREGRSFATRTVQARQRGKPIFTVTLSFMREGSAGMKTVEHEHHMPEDIRLRGPNEEDEDVVANGGTSPFVSQRVDILHNNDKRPHVKRTRQWIKARGKISEEGGPQAHLSALAYMSDSYFIGTVARVHKLWRYSAADVKRKDGNDGRNTFAGGITAETVQKLKQMDDETLKRMQGMDEDVIEQLRNVEVIDGQIVESAESKMRPEIGMMVSLDHTIYFHDPKGFRADDWMFTENESPWAGDGRGLVMQRIYTRDGRLIASCVQEVNCLAMILLTVRDADTTIGTGAIEARCSGSEVFEALDRRGIATKRPLSGNMGRDLLYSVMDYNL